MKANLQWAPSDVEPKARLGGAAGTIQSDVRTIDVDGRSIHVTVRSAFDGIEYVGRLWFAEELAGAADVADHGALPGRSHDDVASLAHALTPAELQRRYQRALSERRRYRPLRRATEDILSKIRHLNQVAMSLQAGLIDGGSAAHEIAATEAQLHGLVERLRELAGLEDDESASR